MMRAMSFVEYRALPGVNWSSLKHLRRSPLHYRHAQLAPEKPITDAMALGSATHCAMLEPMQLPLTVAVWEGGRRAGKEWDSFCEANANRIILRIEDYQRAVDIGAAVRRHELAGAILSSGQAERVATWTDTATGLACRARIDWQPTAMSLLDLKTARSIDKHKFAGACWAYGYFHQLAHYRNGIAAQSGHAPEAIGVLLIAVESEPPHDVAVYQPDADTMAQAAKEVSDLLALLKTCKELDKWPGAHEREVEELRAPVYVLDDDFDFSVEEKEVA